MALEIPKHLMDVCVENGYEMPVMTKNYGLIAIQKYLFTWGVVVGIGESTYNRRYCYGTSLTAIVGYNLLITLDQSENPPYDPPDPYWIKRKGMVEEISNPLHKDQ